MSDAAQKLPQEPAAKLVETSPAHAPSERDVYLRIFENSKDSVFLVSKEGKILFANAKAASDTSFPIDELNALDFRALFLEGERGAIDTLISSTFEFNSGVDPQRVLQRKTGRKLFVELSLSIVEFGGEKSIFCNVRDITQRVKDEEKIKKYSKELETINADLENRVALRTKELAERNHEIMLQKKQLDDVMSHIREAIFTVSPEMRINSEYSAFVNEVFGKSEVAGADIAEFLYDAETALTDGSTVKESLGYVFGSPETWEMIVELLPKELKYKRPAEGGFDERAITVEWFPVVVDDAMLKVMVVCQDVTEQRKLAAEIARKEAAHNEQLELISQLLSLSSELVAQFVADTTRLLQETVSYFEKAAATGFDVELLNGLMRSTHTIKGSARQFKLESIQKHAHEIESKVVEVLKLDASAWPKDLYAELDQHYGPLKTALGDVHAFYEKTVQGRGGNTEAQDMIPVLPHKFDALLTRIPSDRRPIPAAAVRQAVHWLRQAPARVLFDRLAKMAESLATELGREVAITRRGDEVGFEPAMSGPLYDAFLHVVRNTMDHGGQSPEEREEIGKTRAINLTFSASFSADDHLVFEILDDGRGVDVAKVKARAIEKGLLTEEAARELPDFDAIQLTFLPGFSTKDVATELSGRGVGMDMVKEVFERQFGGTVVMHSWQGKGTRLVARVPVEPNYITIEEPKGEKPAELDLGSFFPVTRLKAKQVEETLHPEYRAVVSDLKSLPAVRGKYPSPDKIVCFDTMDPKDVVGTLLAEHGIRHFVDKKNSLATLYLRDTVAKLQSGRIFGIENYLWPGSPVYSFTLREYAHKNIVIDQLLGFLPKLKVFSGLSDILGTISDEMIMNAMFDAPRDEQGNEKYNKLSRKTALVVEPHEAPTLRFGADQNFVAVSIEDPFGAMTYETLVKYLVKCYARGSDQIDQKEGGAGLGLFTIFDNSHAFVINSLPGKRTEMISLIALTRSQAQFKNGGRSLSYFTSKD